MAKPPAKTPTKKPAVAPVAAAAPVTTEPAVAAPVAEAPAAVDMFSPKIIVTSKQEGFRRAGRAWSKAPTQVSTAEFSAEQLAALRDEPMLDIVLAE